MPLSDQPQPQPQPQPDPDPATLLRQLIQEAGNPHIDHRSPTILIQIDLATWLQARAWYASQTHTQQFTTPTPPDTLHP